MTVLPSIIFAQSNLAVLEFDPKGVSETDAGIITDRLRIAIFETGKYTIIEREKMKDILSEQAFQMTGCTSDECVIEAGNILGAALMVSGSVTKIGNTYSINSRLIDVKTGEILNTAFYDVKGEIDDLLNGVSHVVLKLTGQNLSDKDGNQLQNQQKDLENLYIRLKIIQGDNEPMGNITIRLDSKKAPITVANFLNYVNKKAYDGTIFHRVIPGFMIQGGGFKPDMSQIPTDEPITNEWQNGLKNMRGTIAMARTGNQPNSATNQFFINLKDNTYLDQPQDGAGYAVFGKVIGGMDAVDAIAKVQTSNDDPVYKNKPVIPVIIQSITVIGKSTGFPDN